jgi:hypothetical protein
LAVQSIRLAIIELCAKALIWKEYQTAISTILNQSAYAYTPATNQQVTKLISLTMDGQDIDVIQPEEGKYLDSSGSLGPYAYGTFAGFEVHPAPTVGQSIVTYSAVSPTITATTIPDSFTNYVEDIANGALARILSAKDKAYSDTAGAAKAQTAWESAIDDAKTDALTGFSRAKVRTSKVWF